ncbi:uncharacterized protein LOC118764145 isoform X2 [Octopus sinensis]|uniref:Uncharacterized protein LOC118764145 isoform X2 n=1 Tax=Octopus sinensis TaxID=2607531 RepID=A0A7E6F021_9MOLL|nr:uncharacterized protein LOC118764145 isoform X2 [Octopus sinensis]
MAVYFILTYCAVWSIILSETACWGLQSRNVSKQIKEKPSNVKHAGKANSRTRSTAVELPNSIRELILHSLAVAINNAKVNESQAALLSCNNKISKLILKRFPDAKFLWIHNNKHLRFNGFKYSLKNGDLLIKDFKSIADSGVYTCQMVYKQKWKVTLKIYSLTVAASSPKDFPQQHFTSGSTVKINCNSDILGDLYTGSTKQWTINGKVLKHVAKTRANHDILDTVSSVSENQSGIWICMVLRRDNPRKFWITNKLNVVIDPPKTFWQAMIKSRYFPLSLTNIIGVIFTFLALVLCLITISVNRFIMAKSKNKI